jgi:prevent-host-death family protein
MKTLASREAKERFGALLDTVQNEPVTILKNGRPTAVVISPDEYARLGGSRERIFSLMDQMQEEAAANGLTQDMLSSIINDQ